MELAMYKNSLLHDIQCSFNTRSSLERLALACDFIKRDENSDTLPVMPAELLNAFYRQAYNEYASGICLTDSMLDKEIERW